MIQNKLITLLKIWWYLITIQQCVCLFSFFIFWYFQYLIYGKMYGITINIYEERLKIGRHFCVPIVKGWIPSVV